MLNWIRAVSGAVSNLPSAPTKTVLGSAVSVGAWAMANAARVRTVQRMRAVDFIGFLQKVSYTPALLERERWGKLRAQELFWATKLPPQGFHDQTEQGICRSIGKKNPRKFERITSHKRDWASQPDKKHNRVGEGHRGRCGCEGV